MAEEGEESLGSGLSVLTKFANMKDTVGSLYNEFNDLIQQCQKLKTQRQTLSAECDDQSALLSSLKSEIALLQTERDFLSTANERSWIRQETSRPSTPGIQSVPGFDTQGRLNRKIWMLEQQLKAEATRRDEERMAHMTAIEHEQSVAAGLRERVGKLDTKVKQAEGKVVEVEERENRLRKEAEERLAMEASQQNYLSVQLKDLKESWEKERAEKRHVDAELERVRKEKLEVEGELRALREVAAQQSMKSPTRVLQPQEINIDRSRTPTTPTKGRLLSADPANPFLTSPIHSPTTSLARRFAYLEERHALLKAEYEKLRAKYSDDLKHWKEYKAVETARINLKKQRKAEKKGTRSKTTALADEAGIQANTAQELVAASDGSQSLAQQETVACYVQEPTQVDNTSSVTAGRSSQVSEGQHEEATPEIILPTRKPVQRTRSASTPPQPSQRPPAQAVLRVQDNAVYGRDFATPTNGRSVLAPDKVSSWLGQDGVNPPPLSSAQSKRGLQNEDDDIFGDGPAAASSTVTVRTPLVRDRGATTTLRHSALRKTVSVMDASTNSPDWGDVSESTKKRKHTEIEAMSPAQKAAELKRLSKMTGKEKREYYAEYKGKGRYLPPEEVRTGVFEEYEIDPKENEGHNFQFHDVKRQKAERKQMHGGDCECCQGYYEAIGHIPRFNEAPRWKDTSPVKQGETSLQAEMQEHQNKVSRHRETWRRPPTPPGYWSIGFPTTQDVKAQNEKADEMVHKREAEVRREAAHRDSKWKKKG